MEIWILTLLALRPKFGSMARMYEKRAETESLNMTDDVYAVVQRMNEINDLKRRAVNAKVLCDRISCKMGEDERYLTSYLTRSAAEIAESEGCSRVKVHRILKRLLRSAAKTLSGLGYDGEKMRREYADIPLFARTYARLKRAKTRERETKSLPVCEAASAALAAASV